MKEVIAVIRPKKVIPTQKALENVGFSSITAMSVLGRGKQKGIAAELGITIPEEVIDKRKTAGIKDMEYIPKRLLSMVVGDDEVDEIVKAIIAVNQTGQIGDGKIFVCPIEDAIRVRTKETGDEAIK